MQLETRDRIAIGAGLLAATCLAGAAWLSLAAGSSGSPDVAASLAPAGGLGLASAPPASPQAGVGNLVIDVEGAVAQPGIVVLPAGSRVADAILEAGGYAKDADLAAAASAINLAGSLTDGQQVYVPAVGEASAGSGAGSAGAGGTAGTPGGAGAGSGSAGGLVNINTATPEELDALYGIGPVTTQKIVAARAEQPFTSVEEMVERGVIDRGQMEDIRDLVTF